MKKTAIVLMIVFLIAPCFAAESPKLFFPSKRLSDKLIYPVDSKIGTVSKNDKTEYHSLIAEALKTEFDFEWAEKYLHEETKVALVKILTPVFAEVLPCKEFVLSNSVKNGDDSISISAHLLDGDYVVSFVIKDSKFYGVSIKEN